MSYLAERQAAQGRFATEWGSTTPVAWPNRDFRPPAGKPWVRFRVQSGPARQASFGGTQDLYRHDGDVIVEVFTPRGEGEKRALELADQAAAIYRGLRLTELNFFTPFATPAEVVDGWWKVDVIIPFERDERFTAATA